MGPPEQQRHRTAKSMSMTDPSRSLPCPTSSAPAMVPGRG
ncbi:hypothetical protein ACP70R_017522 [Stipagrostis hirtigluma subsp. patula]